MSVEASRPDRSPHPPSKRYFESYVWNTIARIGDFGLAYLFSVLLARMLDTEGYGSYASVLSIATLVLVLSSVGIDKTLNRYLGAASASPDGGLEIPPLLRSLLIARTILVGVLTVAVFLGRGWISEWFANEALAPILAVTVLYLVTQSLVTFVSSILTSFLRTRIVGIYTFAFRAANLLLAYVLLMRGAGVREIMLLVGVTSAVLLIAYITRVAHYFRGPSSVVPIRPVLAFAAHASILGAVSFGLGRPSDVILLNVIRHSQTEVALYDVAYSLARTVAAAFTIGLFGIALTLFAKRHRSRPESVGTLWRSVVVLTSVAVVPTVLFLIVNARACVLAIYGPRYADAALLLQAFAVPMTVGWLFGGETSATALQSTDHIARLVRIRVAAGIANVVLNIFLILAWGPLGALLGTGIVGGTAFVFEAAAARRSLDVPFPLRHIAGTLTALAVALVPSILARPSGWGELALHAAAFGAIYLGILAALRPLPPLDDGLVAALPAPAGRFLARLGARASS
jgi:O-antigen/teichoic acid export membrane protein